MGSVLFFIIRLADSTFASIIALTSALAEGSAQVIVPAQSISYSWILLGVPSSVVTNNFVKFEPKNFHLVN